MACPRCASLLRDGDDGRACVNGCGVFLDRSRLGKVGGWTAAFAAFLGTPHKADGPACPGCAKPMHRALTKAGDADLEIDLCAKCGGAWFDAGEVQRYRSARPHREKVVEHAIDAVFLGAGSALDAL